MRISVGNAPLPEHRSRKTNFTAPIGQVSSKYAGTGLAAYYFSMQPTPSVGTLFLFMAGVIVITVVSFFFIPSHIPRNMPED